jgi:hypothetical protein
MINSRNIDDLRSDVAANCKIMVQMCKDAGLSVLITGTVRDEEYQLQCYNNGYSKAKVPSFHSVKAGLAFDICKNVKGHEYDDLEFFSACAEIGKKIGFEWGGDWQSFVDRPHFQWSGEKHEYTSKMIIAGQYPPTMPEYKEGDTMTADEAKSIIKSKAGLSDDTIQFLYNYRFGDALLVKLAEAMQ